MPDGEVLQVRKHLPEVAPVNRREPGTSRSRFNIDAGKLHHPVSPRDRKVSKMAAVVDAP